MLEVQQSSKTRTSFNPSKLGEAATLLGNKKANLTSLELQESSKAAVGGVVQRYKSSCKV